MLGPIICGVATSQRSVGSYHIIMTTPDHNAGLHVSNSYFAALLHAVHYALDPVCAATASLDASHGWAPCSSAKLLFLVILHLAGFMLLQRLKSAQPPRAKKSVIDLANECMLPEAAASGAGSAVRAPDAAGLQRRK